LSLSLSGCQPKSQTNVDMVHSVCLYANNSRKNCTSIRGLLI